jgi:hypothetical protein
VTQRKTAIITGITGQDGSYLAELLLSKGYEVPGIIRRASSFNTERINHIYEDPHQAGRRFHLHYGDLTDGSNISRLIERIAPDEIYNLAAQSHVKVSFEVPEYTAEVDALGTIRLLDAIKDTRVQTRFYQASTSELYGKVQAVPQNEDTPFYPRSPYAAAKLYAYWATVNYREAYGLYACNGILFNHESERRGETSPQCATGATRRSSWRACGACCSRTSPTTSSWPPARPTRWRSSARRPSPWRGSPSPSPGRASRGRAATPTVSSASRWTHGTSGPPRWISSSATLAAPSGSWAGNRR